METLPTLKSGDSVEIIAPASRCSRERLEAVKELLSSWNLNCIVADDIFGNDLLCANSDAVRFQHLKNAFSNPKTKAIICVRGGYGSMRLIPDLARLAKPNHAKIFVGMSDTTALHLYLHTHWQWSTIHAGIAPDKFNPESLFALNELLFAKKEHIEFDELQPLNSAAQEFQSLTGDLTGGNLSIIQTSIGTTWQMDPVNKIILLEEIGERAYRVDRMLEHMRQAKLFTGAKAILFGDFIDGNEPNGSSLIAPTLERFARECEIPVFRLQGIGHGATNYPIPLNMEATLLGKNVNKLVIKRT